MIVGTSHTLDKQQPGPGPAAKSSPVAAYWYGPLLSVLALAIVLTAYQLGYYPEWSSSFIVSIAVAVALLIGGELFVIDLPFSWGTAQVSVGSICALGVAIWLGPVYTPLLIAAISFAASFRQWKHIGLSIENAGSAALSAACSGLLWWSLVPDGANPLTSWRTTIVFLAAALLHSLVNFGTVVIGTGLARDENMLKLAITMSGGRNFIFTIPVLAAFIPLIGSQSPIALLFLALPLVSSHLALRALWQLETDTQVTLAALTDILELRDPYTAFHSERVSIYAAAVAKHVPEVTARELATIERASRIHDIGKAAVRDAVLLKNGPLSDEERRSMESHPSIGADLIARMYAYRDCVELIRHHHERWDGGGYPSRLIGDRIPLGARIISVADALDAMTTDRPYRNALTFDEAVAEIKRNSRSQFDPDIVEAFLVAISDVSFPKPDVPTASRLSAD